MKVTVLGAAGGIGQPLSLLLTNSELPIDEIALFDIRLSKGVATDLSHITDQKTICGFEEQDSELDKSLNMSDVVVIVAGIPRKPGMSRDDLFKINGKIIGKLVSRVSACSKKNCLIAIISNPVNSLVPLCVETLKKNPLQKNIEKRVFGVTTLDLVRSITFLNENESNINKSIVVIGGHSGKTILPIIPVSSSLKKTSQKNKSGKEKYDKFINRVQFAGDEVVEAKKGMGSATLSMAHSGFLFVADLIKARTRCSSSNKTKSSGDISNCIVAYVCLSNNVNGSQLQKKLSNSSSAIEYFSVPVVLEQGTGFIKELDYSRVFNALDTVESQLLIKDVIPQLSKDIIKGVSFVRGGGKL